MNRFAALALAACTATPTLAETNVGGSIGIYQPGVYGRIDIGGLPPPAVVDGQPIIVALPPMMVRPQPAYLYAPPGHKKN